MKKISPSSLEFVRQWWESPIPVGLMTTGPYIPGKTEPWDELNPKVVLPGSPWHGLRWESLPPSPRDWILRVILDGGGRIRRADLHKRLGRPLPEGIVGSSRSPARLRFCRECGRILGSGPSDGFCSRDCRVRVYARTQGDSVYPLDRRSYQETEDYSGL